MLEGIIAKDIHLKRDEHLLLIYIPKVISTPRFPIIDDKVLSLLFHFINII